MLTALPAPPTRKLVRDWMLVTAGSAVAGGVGVFQALVAAWRCGSFMGGGCPSADSLLFTLACVLLPPVAFIVMSVRAGRLLRPYPKERPFVVVAPMVFGVIALILGAVVFALLSAGER